MNQVLGSAAMSFLTDSVHACSTFIMRFESPLVVVEKLWYAREGSQALIARRCVTSFAWKIIMNGRFFCTFGEICLSISAFVGRFVSVSLLHVEMHMSKVSVSYFDAQILSTRRCVQQHLNARGI